MVVLPARMEKSHFQIRRSGPLPEYPQCSGDSDIWAQNIGGIYSDVSPYARPGVGLVDLAWMGVDFLYSVVPLVVKSWILSSTSFILCGG